MKNIISNKITFVVLLIMIISLIMVTATCIHCLNHKIKDQKDNDCFLFSTECTSYNDNPINNFVSEPPSIIWNKTFGGPGEDWFYCVQETADKGFITTGQRQIDDIVYAWIVKLDSNGVEKWNLTVPGSSENGHNRVEFIQQLKDKSYIACGVIGENAFEYDGFLLKINAIGKKEWMKIYPYGEYEYGGLYCVQQTSNNNYIAVGNTKGIQNDFSDGFLLRTDESGEELWKKSYSMGDGLELFSSVLEIENENIILSGTADVNDSSDVWLLKTDKNGEIIWEKTFGSDGSDASLSRYCYKTNDGGFILGAITNSIGAGKYDNWLIKTDEIGNIKWTETYGTNKDERNWCLGLTDNNDYLICCAKNYRGFSTPKSDICILRIDKSGNIFWTQSFGGDDEDRGYDMSQTSDGGYIVCGRTESFGSGDADGWIIKLGSDDIPPQPELIVKKPKEGWIYLWDLLSLPFPFSEYALMTGDLTFKVEASDPNGIDKVEFFMNNEVVEELFETPYTYEFKDAEKGEYVLKIRAYNKYGGTNKEIIYLNKIL